MTLAEFLDQIVASSETLVLKRLSANDTGATGAHQAGPYVPKEVAFALAPSLQESPEPNPSHIFPTEVISHGIARDTRLVWYRTGTRNECRITRWGSEGRAKTSVLDPALTGSLLLYAFTFEAPGGAASSARVWFCSTEDEERQIEEVLEPVEPGTTWFRHLGHTQTFKSLPYRAPRCTLTDKAMLPTWRSHFPSAEEIIELALRLTDPRTSAPDRRLMIRRECEFSIFKAVERHHVLPTLGQGFAQVDDFIDFANSVTNRRKSRSGRSFELQLKYLFNEESLLHSHGARTEQRRTPDFLFPSSAAYLSPAFPSEKLRMLAVKTTCKDRWRQILDEAARIPVKHLATLQEGMSKFQFEQMRSAGVVLVVPLALHKQYPAAVRPHLVTIERFIAETKALHSGA